jgi:MFS family permease
VVAYFFVFHSESILFTVGLFFLFYLVMLVCIPAVTGLVAKYGFHSAFPFALLLLTFVFVLFAWNRFIAGFVFFGFAAELWWYSYHLYFTKTGDVKHFGRQIGVSEILNLISSALAPLLGAYIIVMGGNTLISIIASIITIITFVISLKMNKYVDNYPVSFKDIFSFTRTHKRDFVAFVGAGSEECINSVVWPILLYQVFNNLITVAAFSTVILILSVLLEYLVGKKSDDQNSIKMEKIGVIAMSTSWLGKALFQIPVMLGMFDLVHTLFAGFYRLPLQAISYQHAHERKENYIAFREMGYKVGYILGLLVFILIVLSGLPHWFIFFFAAVISLLPTEVKA